MLVRANTSGILRRTVMTAGNTAAMTAPMQRVVIFRYNIFPMQYECGTTQERTASRRSIAVIALTLLSNSATNETQNLVHELR